jgi:hypothetical protein
MESTTVFATGTDGEHYLVHDGISSNGDDAFELMDGEVVDLFGDIDDSGTASKSCKDKIQGKDQKVALSKYTRSLILETTRDSTRITNSHRGRVTQPRW